MKPDPTLFTLAFEHSIPPAPPEIWRVVPNRPHMHEGGKPILDVNVFAEEKPARAHAAWIADGRGEVVSVERYVRAEV